MKDKCNLPLNSSEDKLLAISFLVCVIFRILGASPVVQLVKNMPANAGDIRDTGSMVWEDSLEKEKATCSSILAWRMHEQRNLVG